MHAFVVSLVNTGFNKSDCWPPLESRGLVLLTGHGGIPRWADGNCAVHRWVCAFQTRPRQATPFLQGGLPGSCMWGRGITTLFHDPQIHDFKKSILLNHKLCCMCYHPKPGLFYLF